MLRLAEEHAERLISTLADKVLVGEEKKSSQHAGQSGVKSGA